MLSREELLKIKASLRFAWEPFFSRFGVFTPVQQQAIPAVLDGRDCLLSSRTASGKTEAASAPLVERLKRERWSGLSVVYVSPTRALVNDLFHRLEPPLEELGVTIRPRTADSPHINPDAPPAVLVTTPESFDALLARTPRMFKDARAVILDEIHLLDGQPRGDQLRLLLHRLRALRAAAFERADAESSALQVVALSATVSKPEEVAARYCIDPVIVRAEGRRKIKAELRPLRTTLDFQEALLGFANRGIRKALVFCRSRAECEEMAAVLRRGASAGLLGISNPFGDNIFVHHASLDRRVRLDVEDRFSHGQVGICFATSTLELGIDIGDIDIVILIGPPYSIGSFLQRIGRGNRRTNITTLLGFYTSPAERHLFDLLLEAAESGEQDQTTYSFRPSVVIQQILSYLKQRPDGALTLSSLRMLLTDPATGACLIDDARAHALIDHLVSNKVLSHSSRPGEFSSGEGASLIYEKHLENSNIESAGGGLIVMDDLTGRVIGEIQDPRIREKDRFALGANTLDVVRVEGGKISVNIDNEKGANCRLRFSSGAPGFPLQLARKLARLAGIGEREMPAFELDGRWHLVHGLGDVYGRMLSYVLSDEFGWKSRASAMTLKSKDMPPERVFSIDQKTVQDLLRREFKMFERGLGMGRFQSYLPDELRAFSVETQFIPSRFCEEVNGRPVLLVRDSSKISKLCEVI